VKGVRAVTGCKRFSVRTQWDVAREVFQQQSLKIFEAREERCTHETRRHADRDPVEQIATDDPELEPPSLRKQGASDGALA